MMIFQVFNCYSCLAVLSMNILSVDFSENLHTWGILKTRNALTVKPESFV